MSSEISIEAGRLTPNTAMQPPSGRVSGEADVNRPHPQTDDGFRPWHFFVLASILLATVAVMLARQSSPENLILISLTIASAGLAAAAFYRTLAPLTQPIVLRMGEPVSERTRLALEREKMLVLRTIKELEFDRAMGKVSEKDFDEMAGRLRARALSLMRQLELESGAYAAVIEKELEARVAKRTRSRPAAAIAGAAAARVQSGCPACAASNDVDAVFCKKCGTRLLA